jgi:hypothetical protein
VAPIEASVVDRENQFQSLEAKSQRVRALPLPRTTLKKINFKVSKRDQHVHAREASPVGREPRRGEPRPTTARRRALETLGLQPDAPSGLERLVHGDAALSGR